MTDVSTALASRQPAPLIAHSLPEIERMATFLTQSQLCGVKNINQAVTLLLLAQAEGLHPMIAARDYHLINGRPSLKSEAMLARHQAMGGTVEWLESTADVARVIVSWRGQSITIEWTIAQARANGLAGKDVWKSYPAAMLRWRAVSEGIRAINPGVMNGMYTVEETQDLPPRMVENTAPQSAVVVPSAVIAAAPEPPRDDWSLTESLAILAGEDAYDALAENVGKLSEEYGDEVVTAKIRNAATKRLSDGKAPLTLKEIGGFISAVRKSLASLTPAAAEGVIA